MVTVPPGTKVYGGCGDYLKGDKVSGSYYCGASYSIVLDPSQIKYFLEEFGPSSIAKIIAHEFSHAIQDVEQIRLKEPMHELQADCMAGILLSKGSEELGITRQGIIEMARAAHHSGGGKTHGSGDQRVYALLSGMGIARGTCDASEMEALANNKITDPIYLQIKNIRKTRSASSELDLKQTPYPKSFNMVVNRIKRLEREK